MLLFPLFSYVNRIVVLPEHVVSDVSNAALRFLTPAPYCKLHVFAHLKRIWRIPTQVKDIRLDNVAGILSNAWRLHNSHGSWSLHVSRWAAQQQSVQTPWTSLSSPNIISHIAVAYLFFQACYRRQFGIVLSKARAQLL